MMHGQKKIKEAVCCRGEFLEECVIFFSFRVFDGAPCTSVVLPEVTTEL